MEREVDLNMEVLVQAVVFLSQQLVLFPFRHGQAKSKLLRLKDR